MSDLPYIAIPVVSIKLVKDLIEEVLGIPCEKEFYNDEQQIKVAIFGIEKHIVEFIEPTHASSPLISFLKKRGSSLNFLGKSSDEHFPYVRSMLEKLQIPTNA